MSDIQKELKRLKIEEKLKNILFIEKAQKDSIQWGMNYITFSLSKRIRPLILLESNLIYSPFPLHSILYQKEVQLCIY